MVASSSLSNTKFADDEITPPRHLIWTFLILSQLVWEKAALKHRTLLILRKSSRNKMFKQWLIQIESSSVHSIEPEKGNLRPINTNLIYIYGILQLKATQHAVIAKSRQSLGNKYLPAILASRPELAYCIQRIPVSPV